ncbi:MAG: NADPH-dependent FMN reductase [Candidatus Sericytochromatia bacterium]
MKKKKQILAIVGSASSNSSNLKLIKKLAHLIENESSIIIYEELKNLPHFDPDVSLINTPQIILDFRKLIETSDGVIICTPEYIFSIPSGLKNAIEWCVSTIVFLDKPLGIITASANGIKAHEELQLIMKTVSAKFTNETTLLIQGIKSKFDNRDNIIDSKMNKKLDDFIHNFMNLI